MKYSRLRHLTTALLFSLGVGIPGSGMAMDKTAESELFQKWGEETLRQTHKDLWIRDRRLYADKAFFQDGKTRRDHPAFMWGVGVQLPALNAAATLDPERYLAAAEDYAKAAHVYWRVHKGIGGYDVLPAPNPPDRYYDDNAWMVLALSDLYELSGEAAYLNGARNAFEFVMSCEDEKLGGGLYWRENVLESKNTCTNAPTIVAALRLYQLTKEERYMESARRLYQWTNESLQDKDGLFWDALGIDGVPNKTKFSYNSALMMRANTLFFELTREEKYLQEAQRIARAAVGFWVLENGAIMDGGRFAHMLTEAFIAVYEQDGDSRWLDAVSNALHFLRNEVRDPEGRYPNRWDHPQSEPLAEIEILDMASVSRGYLTAAIAFKKLQAKPAQE